MRCEYFGQKSLNYQRRFFDVVPGGGADNFMHFKELQPRWMPISLGSSSSFSEWGSSPAVATGPRLLTKRTDISCCSQDSFIHWAPSAPHDTFLVSGCRNPASPCAAFLRTRPIHLLLQEPCPTDAIIDKDTVNMNATAAKLLVELIEQHHATKREPLVVSHAPVTRHAK
jgi:hypothetical protein